MTPALFDVVVVDDADDVRSIVKTQLTLSGRFRVVAEGATGRAAVELAAQYRPHVIVLDASMPDMDGITAIGLITAAAPDAKIVMLSGFDAPSLRDTALRLGAVDYVEKASPIKQLPARLLAVLDAIQAPEVEAPSEAVGIEEAAFDQEAEAVLAAHLERFRTFFDQAAIGMATLTLSGTLVRANEALSTILATPSDQIVGRALASFALGDDEAEVARAVQRANTEVTAQEVEHRVLITGSGERWVHTTVAAVRDDNQRPLYLFAQFEDVTARHEALESLRASEERFRIMVESVQDYAIFMLDRNGYISSWNLGAERLKGYSADEIIGQHFRTFYPEEVQAARHPEHELAVALREGRYEEEGWRVRKDGTLFWASVVITTLYNRDGKHMGFAKVTSDRTEKLNADLARDRAAAELATSNEELHTAAQQTEEFLAITAHELQSPVAAINGAADILSDYWDKLTEDERQDTLLRIKNSGARIRRLLDDLLTASRLEAGTFALSPTTLALSDVIDQALVEVVDVVTPAVTLDPELRVYADPTRLVQILTNLLTNAAKYGEPPVTVEATRVDGFVEIRVRDAGTGIPAELLPRLFQKFAKGVRSKGGRGTGLGLFIVRELARMQGGDATYAPGSGFVVRMPAAD